MKIFQAISAILLSLILAAPVSALTVNVPTAEEAAAAAASLNASSSVGGVTITAAMQTRITNGKDRADQEITRRVNALNDLSAHVQSMAKLTADEKTSLTASITSQISTLTDLKVKIDADADITSLKTDIKSITAAYRIFLLVIPQGRITVASDRLKSVADVESAFATKLSARIDTDAAAGKDMTTEKSTLADMQAKISDAGTQADAAVSLVSSLTPDNGDQTKAAANAQALKDAHSKIKVSLQDEVAARSDAHIIVKALTGNADVKASASTTTQ